MKKIILFIVFLSLFCFSNKVQANDQLNTMEEQLNSMDFNKLNNAVGKKVDFKDLVIKAIKGEIDLSPQNVINLVTKTVFSELYQNSYFIKSICIIAILGAVLKNFVDSFRRKEVSELGFYITYIVLIMILFNSLKLGIEIMVSVVSEVSEVMQALIPLVMSLLMMSGYVTSAFAFNSVLFFTVNTIVKVIQTVLVPIITLIAVIQVVNHLSLKKLLTNFTEQAKNGLEFSLKCIGIVFIAILSLQRISTPIVNNLIIKTAKFSVNAVPVVGGVLTGAVETVMYFTKAMRSGFMVAGVIVLIIVSAVPIIKLAVLAVTHKIVASLLEPICEERFIDCINSISSLIVLMLGATFLVIVMFIFYVIITLSL